MLKQCGAGRRPLPQYGPGRRGTPCCRCAKVAAPVVMEPTRMIRPFRPDDMKPVLAIWLAASVRAHDFITPEFWASKLDDMRDIYLPAAQIWVDEREGEVLGFVALVGDVLARSSWRRAPRAVVSARH